ncbi:class I adenylate-forming enzyme family protein [Rudaeicoccus suwonensis]|uniref:Acyl-CoA synthetase (AMP-forming)/AMP-acid ligase II n=1 Tax=Rudaeicoccus suwonensis TaxID=657409 RepID=A0A561E9J0_9MICO|nr:AMP-binding protein [Rudaeicoccus suwonensis]TWE12276.1 acyl-CoA synthetase (AMP-forming)/AMP-acid ligase II [Rudaeicoccus suwonensis]
MSDHSPDIRLVDPPSGATWDVTDISRDADGIAHYTNLPQSLVHMLRQQADERANDEAVVALDGERLTFAQVWQRAAQVAGGLREAGLQPGDRAAIMLPAGVDWVLALWGCLLAGVVAVPINTRFAPPEIDYVLDDSGAAYVFAPGEPLPRGAATAVEPQPGDLAAIFYTSGTTGKPKGALTTHEAFLSNCESMLRGTPREERPSGDAYRTLISVPLFHVTGCNSQLLTSMYAGGTSVIMPTLDVGRLIAELSRERISFMVTVPAVYAMMLAHPTLQTADLSTVIRCGYGGAPIAPDLVHRIKAAFPNAQVSNGFGMTETASLLTSLPDDKAAEHADSVGYQVPVVDLALYLADPQTGVGELLVRGPNITTGYWNKPEQTRDAFIDGWLRTGDMARVAEDGKVYVVDRAKDLINRGGENVYSVEVENALAGAPGVFESAVIAVPNERLGEAVGAVLVPPPGGHIDPVAVTDYLSGRIADFKIPQYIHVRNEPLPRNPGGKILKAPLRRETQWGDQVR